eukprot:gene6953-12062_t
MREAAGAAQDGIVRLLLERSVVDINYFEGQALFSAVNGSRPSPHKP